MSVAKEGEATAVPTYKTGLDFAQCPGVPSWAAEGKMGGCSAMIQESRGEWQSRAVPLEESKCTQHGSYHSWAPELDRSGLRSCPCHELATWLEQIASSLPVAFSHKCEMATM